MSLGIYPVFYPPLTVTTFDELGESLAANFETLDDIASAAGLSPFTAFADSRPVPDGFDGDPDELAALLGESTEWFDPADGRAAMQAIADYVRANPQLANRLTGAEWVVEELVELARILGVAAEHGVRFRLEMS